MVETLGDCICNRNPNLSSAVFPKEGLEFDSPSSHTNYCNNNIYIAPDPASRSHVLYMINKYTGK